MSRVPPAATLAAMTATLALSLFACDVPVDTRGGDADASSGDPIVNTLLGLERSTLVRPEIVEGDRGALRVTLPIKGVEHELELEPLSVRANHFRVFAQREGGALESIPAPPSTTMRGTIVGMPGSLVTGSYMEDGLHARVALGDGEVYWTEPTRRVSQYAESAQADDYVLYRDEDVVEIPKACGLEDAVQSPIEETETAILPSGALAAEGLAIAELALDADFEFFSQHGSIDGTVARMEAVIAAVNQQYESEVNIRNLISAVIVRTTPDDPYTSSDPVTLLQDELRGEWLNNHGDIQRDLVHLFTGRDLDGSTIGIAFTGVVCGSFAFGLSQSSFSTNFACVTDLTAHEMGHNWSAGHCDCLDNTMNPFLTCSNTFSPTDTVPAIEAHRDSRTCLDFGDACPDDPAKLEPGQCGCGTPDTDSDLDGVADCVDQCPQDPGKSEPGQCGCGDADLHSDGDGVADCNDGCPDDGNKSEPGQCGCGEVDVDSDGDGVADCNDGCPDDPNETDAALCQPPVCGDGVCDAGESGCSCPEDCARPAQETSCGDGLDEDCDGLSDCQDPDCGAAAECSAVCSADGESCVDAADCCSGECGGRKGQRVCGGGKGGGNSVCKVDGDSCKRNADCCSRECSKGANGSRTCLPPPSGALQSLGSEEGSEAPLVTGGCSAGGSHSGGAGWLLFGSLLALALRRRSQESRS